ncbi:uncharacterized protein [Drosophila bipectinata]|uniref:uncharacterized protein n=1 Tax=Drosophila bipectinata TaxID=42026 RepID=UPI001C89BE51|nr:uncharacterized protein LOC108122595 [Drosophila bipectinata]
MQKGYLIFAGLLVLAYAAMTIADDESLTSVCQSEDELWGGPDIRKYYFCLNGAVISNDCDPGTYFVNNATVSGCLAGNLINSSCVNSDVSEPDCTGSNAYYPQPCEDPSQYYLCTDDGPKQLTCWNSGAFVNHEGYLGCTTWSEWRKISNCTLDS